MLCKKELGDGGDDQFGKADGLGLVLDPGQGSGWSRPANAETPLTKGMKPVADHRRWWETRIPIWTIRTAARTT
jgi:hypothetical protein